MEHSILRSRILGSIDALNSLIFAFYIIFIVSCYRIYSNTENQYFYFCLTLYLLLLIISLHTLLYYTKQKINIDLNIIPNFLVYFLEGIHTKSFTPRIYQCHEFFEVMLGHVRDIYILGMTSIISLNEHVT